MMPASGSAAVVSPTTMTAAPFGAALGKVMPSRRASRLIVSSCFFARVFQGGARARKRERDLGRHRYVHLGAHGADLADETHDPADLLLDRRVHEPRQLRPLGEREQVLALLAVLDHVRPQLLGDEGHERMQQLQDLVEHPGDRRARLGLRRVVVAQSIGLVSSRYQSQNLPQTNW